jgi:hypothetical protein
MTLRKMRRTLAEHAAVVRRIRPGRAGSKAAFSSRPICSRESRVCSIFASVSESGLQLLIRQRGQGRIEDLIDHRRLEIARELRAAQLYEEAA